MEGYKIEYDQDIPKFLRKYGKKWGATVGEARTTEGYDVWSMDITDSMRESVLYEGQVMYSDRDSDGRQLSKDQIEFYKKSKVRGKDGKLMVLYHGTTSPGFTVFDTDASEGMFYMSSSKMVAGQYSNADYYPKTYDFEKGEGDVYEVYANI